MSDVREWVRAYHRRFHPDQQEATPTTISPELFAFRRKLHDEEVAEVAEAWDQCHPLAGGPTLPDVAHLLHELADVVIVAYGTASFLGVDLEDVIRLALQAGMSKVPNPDPAGKALKPPGFVSAHDRIVALVELTESGPDPFAQPSDRAGHGWPGM